jgi:hypothetical protein
MVNLAYESNEKLEARDYSMIHEAYLMELFKAKEPTPKTIQRIINTGIPGHATAIACKHRLAKMPDIMALINCYTSMENPNKRIAGAMKGVIKHLYEVRRKDLNSYFYRVHDLDTREMPEFLLDGLLGI